MIIAAIFICYINHVVKLLMKTINKKFMMKKKKSLLHLVNTTKHVGQ